MAELIENVFDKQPAESYLIAIEWAGRLPVGASLVSGAVAGTRYPDMVSDNSVISNTSASVSGTQSLIKVKLGIHGMDYRISFLMVLSNGDVLEEDVKMQVREL